MKRIFAAGPWITEHEITTVTDALRNGWYEKAYYYCELFQKEFAEYHARKFGIMTPNCTTSIHLLLTAMGIKDGDEVIVPECTWIATAAPIVFLRAKPVFCDIDPVTWCLDPDSVIKKITKKTKAIMVVDLFGNMPRMDELCTIAREHKIPLVEDSAEALGSLYKGTKAGKFGVASVFSFHRTKTLTTGEGGMLILDNEKLYKRCMFLRDLGRVEGKPYYNSEVTYKYMPFNVQAALGYAQFQRLKELVNRKREIFLKYKKLLSDIPDLQFNDEPAHVFNSVWVTGVVFGRSHRMSQKRAIELLIKKGIPARPFFYPLSSLPAFKGNMTGGRKTNPVAYDISSRGINLPCAMNLTGEQIKFICNSVRGILTKG